MKKIICLVIVVMMLTATITAVHAQTYMNVYSLDGRVCVIETKDFYAWNAVGWYSEPVMAVYALDGRTQIIKISDFNTWHAVGWYSAPVMRVYAADGRQQVVTKSDAPLWKSVGWDYQTNYADNIPFTSYTQQWAVINLRYGPYKTWNENRNYYIDKYFSNMPIEDRFNIKHYKDYRSGAWNHTYLFVPRYKTTNSIMALQFHYGDDGFVDLETGTICAVENGVPFTVEVMDPPGDFGAILKIKNNRGNEFFIHQNFSDEVGLELRNEKILDLTEWKYRYSY